jgi:two-component system, sensor histidine kinase LadS
LLNLFLYWNYVRIILSLKKIFLFLFLFVYINASVLKIENNEILNAIPNSEILIPEKSLSLDEVIKIKNWEITTKNIINFNYSTISRWVKFDLRKSTSNKIFLEYGSTTVEVLNVYITKENKLINEFKTGLSRNFQSRPIDSNKFIFPVDIEKDEIYTIYIESSNNLQPNLVSVTLYSEEIFNKRDFFFNFVTGLIIALLLFIFIYNLIIYFFIKVKSYKYYLIYISSVLILNIIELGYSFKYIYPNQTFLNKIFIQYSEFIFLVTLVFFVKSILELEKKSKFNISLNFLLIIMFLMNIIHTYLYSDFPEYIVYIATLVSYLALVVLIIVTISILSEYKRGNIIAKFLIIPWLLPIVSIFMYVLNRLFFFIDLNILNVFVQFILIIEAMLMSLIIGLKISIIEKEKNELIIKNKNAEINLLQQSKFASMGKMLSSITHQWKQPLMRINSILLDIDTNLERSKKLDKYLDLIEHETDYMAKTIRTFSKYFHPHKEIKFINLNTILEEVLNIYKNQFEEKEILVHVICDNKNIAINGYTEEFKQVLLIIFDNALDSFNDHNIHKKEIICEIGKESGLSFISIENSGNNISDENISQIFDPYFSTKNNKKNEGLGLYIAKMLIEESMNKEIKVSNTENGVKFSIRG